MLTLVGCTDRGFALEKLQMQGQGEELDMDNVTLRAFSKDDIAWSVARHGALYAEAEGFDASFAPLVRDILQAFFKDHDPAREKGWVAEANGVRLGSIFCVTATQDTAKLRLFLLEPQARGKGVGRLLLQTCVGFARDAGYEAMTLWTHESHRAACALYAATGWSLTHSKPVHSFGVDLVEQQWDITF